MTKKLTALILSCLMAATLLASCGKDKDSGKNKNNGSESAISSESAINSESIGSEGVISSEEPSVEEPSVEEPSVEESSVEEPSVEEPSVEEPSVEEPSVEEPSVEEPSVEEPSVEEPSVEEPSVEEPSVEEPSIEEPSVEEPSIEEPSEPEVPSEPDAPSDGAPAPGSYHGIYGNYIFQNSDKLGIVDFLDDNMVFNFLDDKGNVWYMGMYEEPELTEYESPTQGLTFEGEFVARTSTHFISIDENGKLHLYKISDGQCTELEYEAPFETVEYIYAASSTTNYIYGAVTVNGVSHLFQLNTFYNPAFKYSTSAQPMEEFYKCFGYSRKDHVFFAYTENDTAITYFSRGYEYQLNLPEGYTAKDVKKVIANTSLAILFNDNSVYYESEYMIPDLSSSGFEYKGSGTVVDIGLIWGTSEVNELIILMDDKTIYK